MNRFVTRYFAELVPLVPDCDPTTTCDANALKQLVINVIVFLRDISIVIAVLFILWGGFLILTSGGSSDRLSRGKKAITAAVIGIVIVLAAWLAVNIFITTFTDCTGDWWDFRLKCGI